MLIRIVIVLFFPAFVIAQEKFSIEPFFNRQLSQTERDSLNNRIDYLNTIIKNDSLNITAYFERGCIYVNLGLHHKAYYDFSHIIKHDSSNANAYYNRAISRAKYTYNYDACVDLYKANKLGLKQAEWLFLQKCGYYKTKIESEIK